MHWQDPLRAILKKIGAQSYYSHSMYPRKRAGQRRRQQPSPRARSESEGRLLGQDTNPS
jgi:hypothetical protein